MLPPHAAPSSFFTAFLFLFYNKTQFVRFFVIKEKLCIFSRLCFRVRFIYHIHLILFSFYFLCGCDIYIKNNNRENVYNFPYFFLWSCRVFFLGYLLVRGSEPKKIAGLIWRSLHANVTFHGHIWFTVISDVKIL